MKAFLQNEIQLFFSRKNYLVWIVGALAVVFAYRFYYVTQYENYAQTVLEELEENAKILRSGNLSIRGSAWNYGGTIVQKNLHMPVYC